MHAAETYRAKLETVRQKAALQVQDIRLSDCPDWLLDNGILRHRTGGFFSVRGLQYSDTPRGNRLIRPYIDQPEVGLLGFIIRQGKDGVEWLLQAKTEPGNFGDTHIAPSVQATRSNYRQLHGGAPTRYLTWFDDPRYFLSDAANSEQGTRFLMKFNRNAVVAMPADRPIETEEDENWQWLGTGVLRDLLGDAHLVNTDARSVIATAPWALLANGDRLFKATALQRSYASSFHDHALPRADKYNALTADWQFLDVNDMPGWRCTEDGIFSPDGEKEIGFHHISVNGREVSSWCQPLMHDRQKGECVLLTCIENDMLFVYLRKYAEPGFGGRTELGPSLHNAFPLPGKVAASIPQAEPIEICSIDQSDEGGRFMKVMTTYKIVHLRGEVPKLNQRFGRWVKLSMLEAIVRQSGTTTNELRSLVSLLLSQKSNESFAQKLG